jgi:glycosyltransferase involved in cell wall biosynthesis
VDKKALVSIGMPVYNGEKYIRKALDSLLAQDYESFELIISDNASTDRTWEICQEYAGRDSRIRLHQNEQNLGARVNFDIVLGLARGKYFMWAAADDYWYERFVSALAEELERHEDAGVAMCAVDLINEDGAPTSTVRFTGADDPNRKNYYQMFLAICSPVKKKYNFYIYGLFRTELLRKTFPTLPAEHNVDRIFVGLIALAARFRYLDEILHTRLVRASRSRTGAGQLSEAAEILKLGGVVVRASSVPWHRRLYAPVGMMGLGLRMIRTRLYQSALTAKVAYYLHPHKRHSNAN